MIGGSDRITDFNRSQGDKIDLHDLANLDDQAFTFIGGNAYSNTAGEVRIAAAAHSLMVYADLDGDGRSDISIAVMGVSTLTASDFIF
ncbi:hypothetical protein AUP44_27325 [Tistrella mobilis]|uniref:Peptidase M10 serralysin C-terminal domain-containing protein n=3 Tax=Tistrella mobilis TaxID=171437 RepID=A0A161R4C3_9PROT|nr:hypothetical protein AUP44_27325 [Tistrella mobilis]